MSTPFEPGAPPPPATIPLCVPKLGGNAREYVLQCIDDGWVSTAGPFVDRFEEEFRQRVGTARAVSTASGTAALHLAVLVAGVQPQDEVLVSTLTFIASANAISYAGARPVPIDVDANYWQMDPNRLEDFLKKRCQAKNGNVINSATGKIVRAVVPVHLMGHPFDLDSVVGLARSFGLKVIEDAAQALGTNYKGQSVGTVGDVAAFSFNGNKTITCGGGGMLVTNDQTYADRAKYLSTQAKDDPFEYVHHAIGFNYRLTNLQAALGCAQLEQLDDHLNAKQWIAKQYRQDLAGIPGLTFQAEAEWAGSTHWLNTVKVDPNKFGCTSRELSKILAQKGIQTRPLWQPMHRSTCHVNSTNPDCPVAENVHAQALSLPSSVGLSNDDQDYVIGVIRSNSHPNRHVA